MTLQIIVPEKYLQALDGMYPTKFMKLKDF